MKMAEFTYHRPATLDAATALLGDHAGDAKVLAGGQSLVPVMAMRLATPGHVVDIARVPGLDAIDAGDAGVRIGALVRQADAETSPVVAEKLPLVAAALPWIGHRAIRNRGTVCGSIAHADPAAELPCVALTLGATMHLVSARGERSVAASDFFLGYLTTAVADDEILAGVTFPTAPPGAMAAVAEVARRHGDFALVGVAAQVATDADGLISHAAFGTFGVADTPVKLDDVSASLIGRRLDDIEELARSISSAPSRINPSSDQHATAAYRRHVLGVLTGRALRAAVASRSSSIAGSPERTVS